MDKKFDVIDKFFNDKFYRIKPFEDIILFYVDNREKILEIFPDYMDYMLFTIKPTALQRASFIYMIDYLIQTIFDNETPETFNKLMSGVRKKIPMRCPEKGEFIGYKKIIVEYLGRGNISYGIAKLRIPETAQRSSAFGSKCRCSQAFVEEITGIDNDKSYTRGVSPRSYSPVFDEFSQNGKIEYIVGDYVKPDSFDPNPWNECSNGIHFFMTREEAENYIP